MPNKNIPRERCMFAPPLASATITGALIDSLIGVFMRFSDISGPGVHVLHADQID